MSPAKQMAIISGSASLALYSICKMLIRKGILSPEEILYGLQEDADSIIKNGGQSAILSAAIQQSLIEMVKQGTGVGRTPKPKTN